MSQRSNLNRGLRFTYEGQEYEIVDITDFEVYYKRTKGGAQQTLARDRFNSLARSEQIDIHNVELLDSNEPVYLSEKQLEERDRKLEYVKAILKSTPHPTAKQLVKPIIERVAWNREEKTPGFSTVAKWVKTFIASNYRPNSLVNGHHLKGNRTNRLDVDSEIAMHEVIKTYYLSENRPTITQAYNELRCMQLNGDISKIPSLRTFERCVQSISEHKKIKARHGSLKAHKLLRAAGQSTHYSRALEAVQADGQVMDVLLVDEETGEFLGRPKATIFIDVYTRCIIAAVISLTGFSSGSVLETAKLALTGTYSGFGGHFETLHVDNGSDYTSQSLKNLANNLGIQIDYAAPNEPNLKPHIERFFKSLNTGLIHKLPGTTWSNPVHRDGYPSEKKAILTLEKLQHLVKEWITNDYHKRVHDGIKRAPAALWQEYVEEQPIYVYADNHVDMLARQVERRTLNKGRVQINGLTWYSHVLSTIEAELKNRNIHRKVDVYIDINNLGYVLIKDPLQHNNFIRADSTRPEFTEFLSLEEYYVARKELKLKSSSDLEQYSTAELVRFRKKMSMEIELLNDPQSRRMAKNVRKKLQRKNQRAKALSNAPKSDKLTNSTNKELIIDMNFDAHLPEKLD
ncbi:DNA-binding domain-containing protein [Kangiella shandongensis]|uniref:DNA-binding domain-containing protein n=1 Tax=Kangiella shandongensis TaxID=2763258 RepID=UPI001CBC7319|nr:DDE-type integrase/transposase/recombinase [Kangiella shandongensis]